MQRVVAAFAVVAAALAGCGPTYNAGDFADRDITQGQVYLAEGDHRRALERFDAAISNEPDYAPGYLMRGQAWRRAGRLDKALEDFSAAIERGLGNAAYAYVVRADTLAADGQAEAAVSDYERALALKPDYWPARAGRGIVLSEFGDSARALTDLDHAIAHDPGTIKEVLTSQPVQMLSRKGPAAHGIKTVTVTFPTQTILAAAYLARGKLHFDRAMYEPALDDLDQALERVQELAVARVYRGLAYFASGQCMEGRLQLQMLGEDAKPAIRTILQQHTAVVEQAGCTAEMP